TVQVVGIATFTVTPRETTGANPWLLAAGAVVIDDLGPWCWAIVAAGIGYGIRHRRGHRHSAASLLALTILAAAVLVLRITSTLWLLESPGTILAPLPAAGVALIAGVVTQLVAVAI